MCKVGSITDPYSGATQLLGSDQYDSHDSVRSARSTLFGDPDSGISPEGADSDVLNCVDGHNRPGKKKLAPLRRSYRRRPLHQVAGRAEPETSESSDSGILSHFGASDQTLLFQPERRLPLWFR